jgi:hypothetical protein
VLEEGSNKPKYCQQVSNVLEGENTVDFFSALLFPEVKTI